MFAGYGKVRIISRRAVYHPLFEILVPKADFVLQSDFNYALFFLLWESATPTIIFGLNDWLQCFHFARLTSFVFLLSLFAHVQLVIFVF